MNTREKLQEMMKENTGRHMLDSGGYGGRKWEKLAGVDLDATPEAWVEKDWGYSKSMYHYLVGKLVLDKELTASFDEWDKDNEDYYWKSALLWVDEIHATIKEEVNSYNFETTIDGVFQAMWLELVDGDEDVIVLQTHNGADVRGGYSKPAVFRFRDDDWWAFLSGLSDAYLFCDSCDNRWWTDYSGGWESDETKFEPFTNWNEEKMSYTCECGGMIKAGC